MPPATLTTFVSTLSPLLAFSPCINGPSCGWAGGGWQQGWANEGAWSGLSQRYAEGWAVTSPLTVKAELQGTGLSVLVEPTSSYNLTLSCNGTVYSAVADLATTTSANLTGLPFGTHSLLIEFQSRDTARQPSQEGVARITGIEVHREGSTVETSTLDDSAWQTGEIALSAGWSLMSTSNPSADILNETQAALLAPLLSSAVNNSLAWTSVVDATLGFNFTGTDLAVYAPLSPMVGAFEPSVDGVSLGVVAASANVDAGDGITGGQLLWSASGLANGPHRFEMRNVGEGGDGVLLVDSFRFASVQTRDNAAPSTPISSSSLILAPASLTSSARPEPSASSSNDGAISASASLGIYVAAAVGGVALLGLIVLTIFKCRRRRTPDVNGLSSSPPGPTSAGGRRSIFGAPSSFIGNPAPFRSSVATSGSRSRAFRQLDDDGPATSAATATPIWAAQQKSLRRSSTKAGTKVDVPDGQGSVGPLARGLPQPAYERPLEPPEMSAASNANRPSIVSFGATQVSAKLRNADSGALDSRPKSSAAEIGDFGAEESVAHIGNAIPMAKLGSGLAVPSSRGPGDRDSRSVYSDDLASGPPSPAYIQNLGHGQSVYSLGQYYDEGEQDGQYDNDDASEDIHRRPRSRAIDRLSIATGAAYDESAPAPLTPPMEDAPSTRRRNPTTNGTGTPDTFGNPLGNYF